VELALNLVWAVLAVIGLLSWLRLAPSSGTSRCMQFAALAMLILILFPVISESDDLWAVQTPAETDSSLRRDHQAANPHSIFSGAAALPVAAFEPFSFGFQGDVVLTSLPAPAVKNPALSSIQNRPPPAGGRRITFPHPQLNSMFFFI
jgi:hypothetical protein